MSTREQLRKGWCPGALRPMQTGDGLLVRVKPHAGTFSIGALLAIAEAASDCGNGEVDLTSRANFQIRGVTQASLPMVLAALERASLLDDTPEAEAVRNIVVDPLSGLFDAASDVRPVARAIEGALQKSPACRALPAKFGINIAGSDAALNWSSPSDVNVRVVANRAEIQLEGDVSVVADVPANDAVRAVISLAEAFAQDVEASVVEGVASLRRMRDVVSRDGATAWFQRSGIYDIRRPVELAAPDHDENELVPGRRQGGDKKTEAAVIGLPFGRVSAGQLQQLCYEAIAADCTEIRVSPRRMLVVAGGQLSNVEPLLQSAHQLGLIIRANDPRLRMDVCPGAPACANATTHTRDEASRLAAWIAAQPAPWPSVHVSGCSKGCARRAAADYTFVAVDGQYDLIRSASASGPVSRRAIAANALQGALA